MRQPWWKRFDWVLAGSGLGLLSIGLLMLASSALGTSQPYLTNQLLFAGVGVGLSFGCLWLGYGWLRDVSVAGYGLVLLLLAAVAIFARVTRGAASWLSIGPFTLQPSELMKIALLLLLAWLVKSAVEKHWNQWVLFGWMMAALLPPLILILIQPDLGTAVVLAVAWLVAVWISPVNKRILLTLIGLGLVCGALGWGIIKPYQRQRVLTFIHPDSNPLSTGYNVLQSQIAVGSGEWFGRGWGRGTQSHLNFLPEHHTDFIFASLSEEFGLTGSLTLLLLYGLILWRGVRLAWRSSDPSIVLLVGGITFVIIFQALVNIAMNIGLSPVTGIPLPLVSYGGSSLITTLMGFGILESVALHGPDAVV